MDKIKKLTLSNGLKIILAPERDGLATTIAILVRAGSKYETKEINGISHFLEHMCFKGTEKRKRAMDIASELDGIGAKYNAFTAQEYTSYYAKVKKEFLGKAFDVVSDLYLNPVFDEQEIEKEKGVIIEEINMYEDLPSRRVQEFFMELVYGDQPAGWSIAGRKEVIQRIKKEDFLKYRGAHYLPQATVIVVSGGFQEKVILGEIKKVFGQLKTSRKDEKPKVKEGQKTPAELIRHKESDQTHLVLGFRAFDVFDERRYALHVLADILGGGMSSRLFQKIREEMGAAYYVNASADLYSDHGLLMMSAGIQHAKIEQVIKAALVEFAAFKNKLISPGELKRAKDHITGNFFLSLETSDEIGYFYGGQEILGTKLISPDQFARKIKAVTTEDVKKTAAAIVKNSGLNLAVLGPFKGRSFSNILKV